MCLSKLVNWALPLPIEQRIDIPKNYILTYVESQPKLALVQVKITKLGLFEVLQHFIFRDVIADLKQFLQGTVDHCIIGTMILSELTQEINLVDYSRPSSKDQKIATSSQDTSLKDMLLCSLLKELLAKPLTLQDKRQQSPAEQLLKLVLSHFNFHIIGNSADESANDPCTVQVPTNRTNKGVHAILHWEFAPKSVHLQILWQRMVASVPCVQTAEPHFLDTCAPQITKAYITSRLKCVPEVISSLAWLDYFVGAFVGGDLPHGTDEQDPMDGELSCVFQIVSLMDAHLPQSNYEKVELAILWFMDHCCKTYMGDQLQHTSKVYTRMSENFWTGITDDNHVLETFMAKISHSCFVYSGVTNLKFWGRCEPVLSRTLQFLNDLSGGYLFVELVKIEAVKFTLQNHTCKHFPLLGISANYSLSDLRCQTVFYMALTPLLMEDLGEDKDESKNFMLPLTVWFESMTQIFSSSFEQEAAKRMLIGLARDLPGIAFALNTKTSYTMLFHWIYFAYISVLQRAIELWYCEPVCTTPILKLMAEFMQNRSQRLNFDVSSPNGILLFREASKMICTYDPLSWDNHFGSVLQAVVKMVLSVSPSDLLQLKTKPVLLECLTQDHMSFKQFHSSEPHMLICSLTSVSDSLTAVDTIVSSSCCAILYYIVTYLFKHLAKEGKKTLRCREISQDGQRLLHFMQKNTELLQQMMSILMNTIIFEDYRNQSVSRPLLGLTLLNEKYFSEVRATSQTENKREVLGQCFRSFMEGVEQNLLVKNRHRLTQKVSVCRDVAEALHSEAAVEPGSADVLSWW
ncbi:LOW QUALITY PROTEIN: ran-binding protein 17 [Phaethornis superciliosus]